MTAPHSQAPDEGFLDTCIGVIVNPLPTMHSVVRRRLVGWAVILILVISFVQGMTLAVFLDPADFDDVEWLKGPVQALIIVSTPPLTVLSIAFLTAIYWFMSRILGGRGPYGGLFSGMGFAYLPVIFGIPAPLIALLFGPFGEPLSAMIWLGILVWSIILDIFAVQANNNFSVGRAVAAVLIPFAILLTLITALVVFIVVLILVLVNV